MGLAITFRFAIHPKMVQERNVLKIHLQYNLELHAKQSVFIRESFKKKLREGKQAGGGHSLKEIAEDSPLVTVSKSGA
jgi:hypothetical protein